MSSVGRLGAAERIVGFCSSSAWISQRDFRRSLFDCSQFASPVRFRFDDGGFLAKFEHLFGGDRRQPVHHAGDEARPAGLMTCSQAGSVITMEILVEQHKVAPMRVFLELSGLPINGAPALGVLEEYLNETTGNF